MSLIFPHSQGEIVGDGLGRSNVPRCFESHIHAPGGGVALMIGLSSGIDVGVDVASCEPGAACLDVSAARA